MVTVTNMILTKILLAYHISRTAPRAGRCTRGQTEATRSTRLPRDAVFVGNKGFMPKLGKTALVLFF